STQGIGAAIATGLARAGARVGVNGRTEERVERAIASIRAEAPDTDLVPVVADVAGEEGARRAADVLPRPARFMTHRPGRLHS
ncbi:SDR family NAD(P)-dependent oxidoreductase, partial [Streptomyces sp. ms191]